MRSKLKKHFSKTKSAILARMNDAKRITNAFMYGDDANDAGSARSISIVILFRISRSSAIAIF